MLSFPKAYVNKLFLFVGPSMKRTVNADRMVQTATIPLAGLTLGGTEIPKTGGVHRNSRTARMLLAIVKNKQKA